MANLEDVWVLEIATSATAATAATSALPLNSKQWQTKLVQVLKPVEATQDCMGMSHDPQSKPVRMWPRMIENDR